jgi:hypothetical protein
MHSRLAAENQAIETNNAEHLVFLDQEAGREELAGNPQLASAGNAERGRSVRSAQLAPGLEIRGMLGMRLPAIAGRAQEEPVAQVPLSLMEHVTNALRDLHEVARARADLSVQRVRAGLEWVRDMLAESGETPAIRQWVAKAVIRVRALRNAVLGRATRLIALGRAERLHHIALQEWERFNSDYPPGSTCYSRPEWTHRRERRMSVLEQRAGELEKAKLRGSVDAIAVLDTDIVRRASELEAMPTPSERAAPHSEMRPVADDLPLPVLRPRPPALH